MTGWFLLAAELRIPRGTSLAAHRMIVIADPQLQAVRQINGLASWYDRAGRRWRHKPIGYLKSDRLRGYDTADHPGTFLPMNGARWGSRDLSHAVRVGAAKVLKDHLSAHDIVQATSPALEALRRINALSEGPEGGSGLPYPFLGFGPNSNAFFSTMLRAMDLAEPDFARPARIVPGAGQLLLPEPVLAGLRRGYLSTGMSGERNPAMPVAMASTPSAVG